LHAAQSRFNDKKRKNTCSNYYCSSLFLIVLFSFSPLVEALRKLKVGILLQYDLIEWKVEYWCMAEKENILREEMMVTNETIRKALTG